MGLRLRAVRGGGGGVGLVLSGFKEVWDQVGFVLLGLGSGWLCCGRLSCTEHRRAIAAAWEGVEVSIKAAGIE